MSQSEYILLMIVLAFVVYITARGELKYYLQAFV